MTTTTHDQLAAAITTGHLAEAYQHLLEAQKAISKARGAGGDLVEQDAREAACGAQADIGTAKDALAALLSQRSIVVER